MIIGEWRIYAKVQEINEHFQPIELSGFDEDGIYWNPNNERIFQPSQEENFNEEETVLEDQGSNP